MTSNPWEMKRVDKPWGYELWHALNDHYCFKELHVNAGHSLSLQYHLQKTETMVFAQGRGTFIAYHLDHPEEVSTIHFDANVAGACAHIVPRTVHRIHAETDVIIFEASTPEVDDVVRLLDNYDRT